MSAEGTLWEFGGTAKRKYHAALRISARDLGLIYSDGTVEKTPAALGLIICRTSWERVKEDRNTEVIGDLTKFKFTRVGEQ